MIYGAALFGVFAFICHNNPPSVPHLFPAVCSCPRLSFHLLCCFVFRQVRALLRELCTPAPQANIDNPVSRGSLTHNQTCPFPYCFTGCVCVGLGKGRGEQTNHQSQIILLLSAGFLCFPCDIQYCPSHTHNYTHKYIYSYTHFPSCALIRLLVAWDRRQKSSSISFLV